MNGYESFTNSPVIIMIIDYLRWDNVIKLKTPGMVYFHAILHKWHEKWTCVPEITLSDQFLSYKTPNVGVHFPNLTEMFETYLYTSLEEIRSEIQPFSREILKNIKVQK